MIRIREILTEKFFDGIQYAGLYTETFINPTAAEVSTILQNSPSKDAVLRGILLLNGDFYVVTIEGKDLVHDEMYMILLRNPKFPLKTYINAWWSKLSLDSSLAQFLAIVSTDGGKRFSVAESYYTSLVHVKAIAVQSYQKAFKKKNPSFQLEARQ